MTGASICLAMLAPIEALWPYGAVFVSAFASATLLPMASEAVLFGAIKAGLASTAGLLAAATAGNVGGSALNWWMGRWLLRFQHRRWFPFSPAALERATAWFERRGVWVLLLSWLPVVGDPLTLVAGVLRVPLGLFLALVTIGKAARYAVIAALA